MSTLDASRLRLPTLASIATPPAGELALYANTDGAVHVVDENGTDTALGAGGGSGINPFRCNAGIFEARLSLSSTDPTADGISNSTLYLHPFRGNTIAMYDSSETDFLRNSIIGAVSIAIPATTNTVYDVLVYQSGGGLALELVQWTSATVRGSILQLWGGVWVKNGDTSRRYAGTIATGTVSGQSNDTLKERRVWNYYNRLPRSIEIKDATDSWSYGTAVWRAWNGSTANRVNFVRGFAEDAVNLSFGGSAFASQANPVLGIGLDSTTTPTGVTQKIPNNVIANMTALYAGTPAIGLHYLSLLEFCDTFGTDATFYGDNNNSYLAHGAEGVTWQ